MAGGQIYMIRISFLCLFLFLNISLVNANEIYVEQVGDNLDLDIVQDGQNNQFGDGTTDASPTGDDMTFSITQTGDSNDIAAVIDGNDYVGTWAFTGDTNTVDLKCDSQGSGNCETVRIDITTTGDDNIYKVYVGENDDAQGLVATFSVTGDGNVLDVEADGANADITVTIDNSNSLSSNQISNQGSGLATTTPGNYVDINQSGDGDAQGHSITLDVTGGGNDITINQSGIYDNKVDLDMTGDDGDVDIAQSD